MAISKIPSAGFQDNVKFRNIIINGDMSIAQRGTSESGITAGASFVCDRFPFYPNNQGTWTQSQSTDVPTAQGFYNSIKIDCTTADASPSSGDSLTLQHRIEGQNLQYLNYGNSSAKSLTLSFWVKSNKTGTYNFNLRKDDDGRRIVKQYTINSANTWEKKIITMVGDTSGAINNDNGIGLQLLFWLGAGSDYTTGSVQSGWSDVANVNKAPSQVNLADSTSNEWYITGVQLEAGETASNFEFLPRDINATRCYRYLQSSWRDGYSIGSTGGLDHHSHRFITTTWSDGNATGLIFPVEMRAAPTVTLYGGTTTYTEGKVSFNGSDENANVPYVGTKQFAFIDCTSSGGDNYVRYAFKLESEL